MQHRSNFGSLKTVLGTAALATGLAFFVCTPTAKADDCQERIVKADHRLHEAIEHHGFQSKQADHARHELREAREYCWQHSHHWWDVEGNRWRAEHDWDDHDHDHR